MENRKDIGKMVQDTMEQGSKTPQTDLWERLDKSLDERSKKRKRALLFWYSGAGILLLLLIGALGLSYLDGEDSDSISNTLQQKNSTDELPMQEPDAEKKPSGFNSTERDTSTINGEIITLHQNDSLPLEIDLNTKEAKRPHKMDRRTNITNSDPESSTIKQDERSPQDGFVVKTEHSYYNSDVNQTIRSTDKKSIDSIIQANKQRMAQIDSIARARAADSIKLNKATQDTISN